MHKVSRTLLTLGVLAFGTLTAACGDKITVQENVAINEVQSVSVSPPAATIQVNQSIQLVASVVATGTVARTVTWTSSNAAIATVDATGRVTAPATSPGGTVTIIATSTANPGAQGAAVIVVQTVIAPVPPAVSINSVVDNFGNPVNLSAAAGQINVTVNVSNTAGASRIEVFLSTNCTTNTIGATDVSAATQDLTAGQNGPVTLSINTAALTAANAPRFANGNYCIKARLTTGIGSATPTTVVATNTTPITLANTNQFAATLSFTNSPRKTGSPVSAVSSINGLNYNSGNLTVTLNPVIFTSANPVALISGYLTQNGERAGGVPACAAAPCSIAFTNQTVTSGAASITFTDTSATGVRSIFLYNSLPVGDTLYITSATDAAGNPITVTPTPGTPAFVVVGGIRIDNDNPSLAGAYTVTAPNGYIGAAYAFSSGTSGAAASDTKAGIAGVGNVTTTYYVGPAGGTIFNGTAATLCTITGLQAVTSGSQLPNTTNITTDQAKVVVQDGLGNKICQIVTVTTTSGVAATFGVDKIEPTVVFVPPAPANAPAGFSDNNGAAANTGYNVTKNFSMIYTDTISGFTNATVPTPLRGTLVRNFLSTPVAGECVIGTFNATTGACAAVAYSPGSTLAAGGNTAPFNVNSIEFTNSSGTNGYYTLTTWVLDLAGNASDTISRTSAFDNTAPAIGGLTQSPAAAVSLGSVTVSGTATDNVDLTSSGGRLSYGNAPAPFQSVNGTSFGPNFDATRVTTGTASVTLSNVYRGLQPVDGTNTIVAGGATAVPTATITVTDVGTNAATSAPVTIAMSTARADILLCTVASPAPCTAKTFIGTPTNPTPATRQASTNININVGGAVADPSFQNQPFAQIDLYKLVAGELVLVGTNTTPNVTDAGANRTYTYTLSGVALTAGPTANTFYAVGRNAAGDAVISNAIIVNNP